MNLPFVYNTRRRFYSCEMPPLFDVEGSSSASCAEEQQQHISSPFRQRLSLSVGEADFHRILDCELDVNKGATQPKKVVSCFNENTVSLFKTTTQIESQPTAVFSSVCDIGYPATLNHNESKLEPHEKLPTPALMKDNFEVAVGRCVTLTEYGLLLNKTDDRIFEEHNYFCPQTTAIFAYPKFKASAPYLMEVPIDHFYYCTKYSDFRLRNNEASRKSRRKRKERHLVNVERKIQLEQRNAQLKAKLAQLDAEKQRLLQYLKPLFC